MDNMGGWERKNLVNELIQGRELTKQLQAHFRHVPSSSSSSASHEMQKLLIFRILLSYDKALSMLSWNYATGEPATMDGAGGSRPSRKSESPPSLGESPNSGDIDWDNKEHEGNNSSGDSRSKRKTMLRWTKRVRVAHGTLIEGQIDDGLSWRKYGQKDILGAKFPRGYYRCTHKGTQGCLATKQVQQSDEDQTVFEITYCGSHTCSNPSPGTDPPPPSAKNQEPNHALVVAIPSSEQQQSDHRRQKDHDDVLDFYKSLTMTTESSSTNPQPEFEFPSIFPYNLHQFHPDLGTVDFPESLTGLDLFRENQNFRSLDHSELGLVVSAANRTATSSGTQDSTTVDSTGNLDFAFGQSGFDNSSQNTGPFSK